MCPETTPQEASVVIGLTHGAIASRKQLEGLQKLE